MDWRAFELHPETPPEGAPRRKRPESGSPMADSVRILSEEVGLQLKRPDFTANSRLALEATEYAREQTNFEQFHTAVFKAYWEEGKNIGLTGVLLEIAEKCGLDGDELEYRLGEGWYTRQVSREKQEAVASGIMGIPAYIIGSYLLMGARPYETFELAMRLAQFERVK